MRKYFMPNKSINYTLILNPETGWIFKNTYVCYLKTLCCIQQNLIRNKCEESNLSVFNSHMYAEINSYSNYK